jgi:hypothetical protein
MVQDMILFIIARRIEMSAEHLRGMSSSASPPSQFWVEAVTFETLWMQWGNGRLSSGDSSADRYSRNDSTTVSRMQC